MSGLSRWASHGLLVGLAFSLLAPVAVLLMAVFPNVKSGYPLMLLPLLAVGPFAIRGLPLPRALGAILVAGITSAVIASASLVAVSHVLGAADWALAPEASASPMPVLLRLLVLPLTVTTWGPQEALLSQPVVTLMLGLLALLLRSIWQRVPGPPSSMPARPLRDHLVVMSGVTLALTLLVGWLGFAPLEDMRARSRVLQVHAEWKQGIAEVEAALDAEQLTRTLGRDPSAYVYAVRRALADLQDILARPEISAPADEVRAIQDRYQPSLELLTAAYDAHRALPNSAAPVQSVRSALTMLRRQINDETQALLAGSDRAYDRRLSALVLAVGFAGAVGLWFFHRTMAGINQPLRSAVTHLARVSYGDRSVPAPGDGPAEFQRLATAVDRIAADLDRLTTVERATQEAAELKSVREQLFTRTGTALVSATDADKIFQIAVRSAAALAGQPRGVRSTVAVGPVHRMTVVAAHGDGVSEVQGAHMDIRDILDSANPELQQRRFKAFEVGMSTVIGILGFRPRIGSIIVTTLRVRGGKLTMIMLESDDALSDECAEGLARLGADVALALDSAAHKEDMLVQRSEARFRSLVQNSTDVVTIVGRDGVIQYQSPAGERVFGYGDSALLGANLHDLLHPEDVQTLQAFLADVEHRSATMPRVEWRIQHADGSWVHTETTGNNLLDDPHVGGLVLNSRDIGDRRALQDQLTYQAFHDPLTTLPNRALFMDRLEHALIRADRREQAVAMLFLDLDNFKIVNDSLGHQAGDQLLVEAAKRLLECVRTEDTVARLGGDEFTILIEDVRGLDSALEVARRIAIRLRSPFNVVGHEVFSTASIGIAVSGPRVGSAADLLRDADLAMYRAKSEGKARHVVFDGAMNNQAMKRLELETALRRAVERRELRLMYQPIMSLESMGMDRVETLVRWQHPERGLVSPSEFIPVAEETGLIVPIGQWVLREACRQARMWQREFPTAPDLVVSVNLSPRQFQHPTLVEDIARILLDTGLDPERLELEITEGAVMEDADAARATLQKLRDIGISLAIDDFGTGYSSLGYLKRFPVSVLKVDQSFVRGLGQDEQDSAIVRGVIALAQSLNLTVTAEGIETLEQLAQLRELGCDHGQGYLLSRPLTGDALGNLLARTTTQMRSPKHGILRDQRIAS